MIVADILMWFFLIVGTYIVFNSYWLATQGLFPQFVDRCRERIHSAPVRRFFFGLGLTVPIAGLGIAMLNAPKAGLKFGGAAILILLFLAGLCGATGIAAQIGTGLGKPGDEEQSWRRVLRGGGVLGLTFILPLGGWFLILPLTLMMGLGAAVIPGRPANR